MSLTYVDYGDRIAVANDDASHVVWKQVSLDGAGGVVGPGYIGRVIFRSAGGTISGPRPCDGFYPLGTSLNDPTFQGLLSCGWHHYRDIPGETNIWNKGWDYSGGRDAATHGGFGVHSASVVVAPFTDANGFVRMSMRVDFVDPYSAAEGKRVAYVRYDYIFEDSDVKVWTTLVEFPDGPDSGPTPYVKEPKYAVGVGGSTWVPAFLDVIDASSTVLADYDLANDPRLQDPTLGTEQVPWGGRTRMRFYDGTTDYFNVVARGNGALTYDAARRPTNYGLRDHWAGDGSGLDQMAVSANSRAHLDDSVCNAYCLNAGGLWRRWKVAKRGGDPRTEVMFHGWEGGSGLPDCLCAARAWQPGDSWTNYFSISRNAGWVL